MNERIKELMNLAAISKADFDNGSCYVATPDKMQKFAELIVSECVKVAHPKLTDVGEWAAGMRLVQQRLKQNFGVEE